MAGLKGRSGKVSTKQAHARRMAASAAGGAVTAARSIAASIGGGDYAEAAGYIMQRQKAQMAKASIQAQLLKLDLDERKGVLRPVAQVSALLSKVAAALRRVIRVSPSLADGLGLPADEAAQLRKCIEIISRQLTSAMAKELEGVADEAAAIEGEPVPVRAPEPA